MPTPDLTAQYHVYGNAGSGGPIDYGTILATVTSGTAWTSGVLAASSSWTFAVRAFDPATGLEDANVDVQASLVLDAGQNDVTNLPAAPVGLTITPAAAGFLRVEWHAVVSSRDAACPTSFAVYIGTGGTPSYAAPVLSVPAWPGVSAYRALLQNLTPGVAYTVGVRAVNATGIEANTVAATATSDATPPANVTGLTATLV
jgi:hypothetical protein